MSPSGDGWFGRPILRPAKEPPLPQIQHPAGHPRVISALQEGLITTQPKAPGPRRSETAEHDVSMPDEDGTLPGKTPRPPHDTQEEALTTEERHTMEEDRRPNVEEPLPKHTGKNYFPFLDGRNV